MKAGSRIGGLRFGCTESDVDVLNAYVIAGKPAPTEISSEHKFVNTKQTCGSRLASDER
jgi:hypothetical protein